MSCGRTYRSGLACSIRAGIVALALIAPMIVHAKPAFLDASDQVDVALSQPVDVNALYGHVTVTCGDSTVPVMSMETCGGANNLRLHLMRPISASEVSEPMSVTVPGEAARTIYARDVLSEPQYFYSGGDLGATYTKAATMFKVWSPVSSSAALLIYSDATGDVKRQVVMTRGDGGIWQATAAGDLDGAFYQYQFMSYGVRRTTPDIYGRAASEDLRRSVVLDLSRTDPARWSATPLPHLASPTDAVVYEAHIADFTNDPSSGVPADERGKYVGVVADGTHVAGSEIATGLDYLRKLGVTHLHLLPFQSLNPSHHGYNWGYETYLFNVPEPRYATHPNDPASVIRDVKTMVEGLHRAGIGLVMDVVYNHTVPVKGDESPYWATVPYYYVRTDFDGTLRNESGVGNSINDEHPMVRKFIIDSLLYWQREYKVDGFRFDLMGMFSPETVRAISYALHSARSDELIYGEPWTLGPIRFGKAAQRGMGVAVFNDNFRNALRGDMNGDVPGFALGGDVPIEKMENLLSGSPDFTDAPTETMNYVSIHDDMTYLDKVAKTLPQADFAEQADALKFAGALTILSQGVPILEGGVELGRTKGGSSNSFNLGDATNDFDWQRGTRYQGVSNYFAGLIALRKSHPMFRCSTANEVRQTLSFLPREALPPKTVAFTLDGAASGDSWRTALVIFHGATTTDTITLSAGLRVAVNGESAQGSGDVWRSATMTLAPLSATVLYEDAR